MDVPPEYVLIPPRVNVPRPVLIKRFVPERIPVKVIFERSVLKVTPPVPFAKTILLAIV